MYPVMEDQFLSLPRDATARLRVQIDAGRVRWTGDAELGSRAARNLRYTM